MNMEMRSRARCLSLLLGAIFLLAPSAVYSAPMPLKEVLFLVRQRQPEPEILEEIARRKLAEKPDTQAIDKLLLAGASGSFIHRIQAPELVAPQRATPVP